MELLRGVLISDVPAHCFWSGAALDGFQEARSLLLTAVIKQGERRYLGCPQALPHLGVGSTWKVTGGFVVVSECKALSKSRRRGQLRVQMLTNLLYKKDRAAQAQN
jgi:hypothetical protein